jgi:hypothetical protein
MCWTSGRADDIWMKARALRFDLVERGLSRAAFRSTERWLCVDLVHKGEWNSRDILRAHGRSSLARRPCRAHARPVELFSYELREDATMSRVKQASTRKRTGKAAATVLSAAGLGFSLMGTASASTAPTTDVPQSGDTSPNQRFVLGEEEMADVSLATFYLFDKENVGGRVQLARGCGGCGHGCGGCRGCGGGGCRGCRGCGFGGGCGGCGVGIIGCVACAGCAGCCLSWGACRLC